MSNERLQESNQTETTINESPSTAYQAPRVVYLGKSHEIIRGYWTQYQRDYSDPNYYITGS